MKLDQFLKWQGWVSTGGEAKLLIKQGEVLVNGLVETRRGRKISSGDLVCWGANKALLADMETRGP